MNEEFLIENYLKKAEKAFKENKLLKALDLYTKVNDLTKGQDVDTLISMALIYDFMGKSKEAKELYRKSLELDENDERAYYGLAVIYDEEGCYSNAIQLYKRAIHINPNYHKAYFFLANAYDMCGDKDSAVYYYEKLLELNPSDFWANVNLGSIYEEQGKNDSAYKRFSKALEIDPKNHLALFNMGVICYKYNMKNKAAGFYERSIKSKSDYPYSYLNLAVLYKYSDTMKGIGVLTEGINNCEEVHFLYYNRGCFYALLEDKEKAFHDIKTALKIYPEFLKYILEDDELKDIIKMREFTEFTGSKIFKKKNKLV
ncbi:MAG: tetratricopeptide repeat protein [Clostridiaceae bacterium]